ncbi:putative stress-induced protein [Legionella israelensis]|uniref:Putative stress-induced protein n=2 Tax=Legionella israelensis TaxID=454 RepID=A0A0W0VY60_9GAMM|nr:putative stress-induced protein [Legionella israelensis]SCY19221.1 TIGR00255 family protein [Legionella israelensis DSM 19235]STX57552.1 putative stress-induced protein [Legionella israelensis]
MNLGYSAPHVNLASIDMTYSMTAFARTQKQLDDSILCWEIKSVNHRYLDVSFRVPEPFRFMEIELRSLLRNKLSRGKLECQLKYTDTGADKQSILVNKGLVTALMDAAQQLSSEQHIPNDLSASQILSWPGVVQANPPDTEMLSEQAKLIFQETLNQLITARKKEGQALRQHILQRLDHLGEKISQADGLVAIINEQLKDKLMTRLKAVDISVTDTRIEQEMALLIARMDVREELDRLHTHVNEVRLVLEHEQAAGRRLDFLMQELNREANTLGSKSDSVQLTRCAVEMKVLIEQMREQIQNIE